MKKLAQPILVFALLGLASLFVPGPHGTLFGIYAEFDTPRLVLLLFAFTGAAIVAGLALRRVRPWHGYTALGWFALAMVKSRVWMLLRDFGDASIGAKLLAIAITGGVIFTLLATVVADDQTEAAPTS